MSKSEAVKRWRHATKRRMVKAMGDCCQICGYDKCIEALSFHHIDPTIKSFSFGSISSSPKAWHEIVAELKKCVLLCHNCHSELHYGLATLPETYATFDENMIDYKKAEIVISQKREIVKCPICDVEMPNYKTYCSHQCAAKGRGKVDWDSIDLPELLKIYPSIVAVSEHLNISDAAVHKRMKKLGLK